MAVALGSVDHRLFPERLLTLLQPTPALQLGAVEGTLRFCLRFQDLCLGESFVEIADRHGLALGKGRLGVESVHATVRGLLAIGVDPEKSVIYLQSDVPQACELMWTLACLLGHRSLDRDSPAVNARPSRSLGSLLYPLLRAAGVLCLRATRVSAGVERPRWVELARSLARRLNAKTDMAVVPEPLLVAPGPEWRSRVEGSEFSWRQQGRVSIFAAESVIRSGARRAGILPEPTGYTRGASRPARTATPRFAGA